MGWVFTALLLFLELIGGVGLAQVAERLLQGELVEALGGHLAGKAHDGGGLAGAALLGGLQALGGEIRAGGRGVDALLLRPDQQAERGDQGEAVEELAGGCHALASGRV
ncbi:hypothetical protein B597_016665 [Stutzerimonas stutzeri KOS6]|uniref:Uncharacterized protein n=1 Tax=Stutzerimonas stutzeri KOS6 TaxID=1218352 RepID=A0A061JPU1_STUST|nr:hypothetical protein B597_016665 [Stutzerimonas stutzeri KOS6]